MSNKDCQEEVVNILNETQALLKGHFILRSGLHSGHFFQCARLGEHLTHISRLATLMLEKLGDLHFQTVIALAMGGLVIGQEVARQAQARYIFLEKIDSKLALKRDFKIAAQEKILLVEDVVTRGGRLREALTIIEENGGEMVGIAALIDRSGGKAAFPVPYFSLLNLSFPTYEADDLPKELESIPAIRPGH